MITIGPNIVDLLEEMGYYETGKPLPTMSAVEWFKQHDIEYENGFGPRTLIFKTKRQELVFRIKYGHVL